MVLAAVGKFLLGKEVIDTIGGIFGGKKTDQDAVKTLGENTNPANMANRMGQQTQPGNGEQNPANLSPEQVLIMGQLGMMGKELKKQAAGLKNHPNKEGTASKTKVKISEGLDAERVVLEIAQRTEFAISAIQRDFNNAVQKSNIRIQSVERELTSLRPKLDSISTLLRRLNTTMENHSRDVLAKPNLPIAAKAPNLLQQRQASMIKGMMDKLKGAAATGALGVGLGAAMGIKEALAGKELPEWAKKMLEDPTAQAANSNNAWEQMKQLSEMLGGRRDPSIPVTPSERMARSQGRGPSIPEIIKRRQEFNNLPQGGTVRPDGKPNDASPIIPQSTPQPSKLFGSPFEQQSDGSGPKALDRSKYIEQLDDATKTKLFALTLSEVGYKSESSQRGLMETIFNRNEAHGHSSLDKTMSEAYYEPMQKGGIPYKRNLAKLQADPALRAKLEERLKEVLAGSNDSNFGTHNGSQGVAERARNDQTITVDKTESGETFSRKDMNTPESKRRHGAGIVSMESKWYKRQVALAAANGFGPGGKPQVDPENAFGGDATKKKSDREPVSEISFDEEQKIQRSLPKKSYTDPAPDYSGGYRGEENRLPSKSEVERLRRAQGTFPTKGMFLEGREMPAIPRAKDVWSDVWKRAPSNQDSSKSSTPNINDKFGLLSPVNSYYQERRKGEPGEFNFAGSEEGRRIYGDAGTNLSQIVLNSGKKVQVNSMAADQYKNFFNQLEGRGYPITDIGGYNYRNKAGGGGLSMHSYGTAVDINVNKNPMFGRGAGTTNMPANVEKLAWLHGLSWGGRFGDAMHFEPMSKQAWNNKLSQLHNEGFITKDQFDSIKKNGISAVSGISSDIQPKSDYSTVIQRVDPDISNTPFRTSEDIRNRESGKKAIANKMAMAVEPMQGKDSQIAWPATASAKDPDAVPSESQDDAGVTGGGAALPVEPKPPEQKAPDATPIQPVEAPIAVPQESLKVSDAEKIEAPTAPLPGVGEQKPNYVENNDSSKERPEVAKGGTNSDEGRTAAFNRSSLENTYSPESSGGDTRNPEGSGRGKDTPDGRSLCGI